MNIGISVEKKIESKVNFAYDKETLEKDFAKLQGVLEKIKGKPTIHEGLPHQYGEKKLYELEKKTKAYMMRYGYAFYSKESKVKGEDIASILKVLTDINSYSPNKGIPKLCGGYHPDFTFIWPSKKENIELHICFGCNELKVYSSKANVYCDIKLEAYKKITKILSPYQKRPME